MSKIKIESWYCLPVSTLNSYSNIIADYANHAEN